MQLKKSPIAHQDESFLFELYSTTRLDELALVSWNEEQKSSFLHNQYQAQHHHYFLKYPDASFQIIKLGNKPIGRIYTAELETEIRILDLTILPELRGQKFGTQLIKEVLSDAEEKKKAVQIYLETYNSAQTLFRKLNFQPVADDGLYVLWRWDGNFLIAN